MKWLLFIDYIILRYNNLPTQGNHRKEYSFLFYCSKYNDIRQGLNSEIDSAVQSGCAPSENSDQPGHPPSLIRVFAVRCAQWVAKDSSFLHADSEGSDQTGRSLRSVHTHFVAFFMSRLKFK